MKCYYCGEETKHRTTDDSLDTYRYIEGRPIRYYNYECCENCGSCYEYRTWGVPYKKPELLATRKQVNALQFLFSKNDISIYSYRELLFRDYDSDDILISRKHADKVIKTINLITDWKKQLEEFVVKGCPNEYLRSYFTVNDSLLIKLLSDGVDFL